MDTVFEPEPRELVDVGGGLTSEVKTRGLGA